MTHTNYYKHRLHCMAVVLCICLLGACGQSDTTQKTTVVKKTDSAKAPSLAGTGLTLPVLDALFFEEGFAQELKTKLQLSDAQVQKLKAEARASVSDLDEQGDGSAYLGSARAAAKRSEAKLREILGDEKLAQLNQLVSQRYAGGDLDGLLPNKPNAVATDTRIVVNTPAYRMDVFQDGRLLKTFKVGIGYPEFPLPAGMRRAENIIFNPTWTPPDEPWVKGKVQAGKQVEAGSRLNPLGPIKIPIGAPSLIHGGKAVAKLGGFASHGCVGMTDGQVQDFAMTLAGLAGTPLTMDDVQGYAAKKTETKSLKLAKAIPVELRYETIVGESGGLRIYRDVYERGTNTLENARAVLQVYGITYESLSPQEQSALQQALAEMNRDPQGNTIADETAAAAGDAAQQEDDAAKDARAKKGAVTKAVAGRKEAVVPIAGMQGKGYPAPVNLNAGEAPVAAGNRP